MQATALILAVTRETDEANKTAAFDRAVRQSEAQILRIAYRILGNWADAEDVAQDVFIRLHGHGLTFANETALNAWLYRVTVNRSIDRRRSARPTYELPEVSAGASSAEADLLRGEQKRLLMNALASLPPRERAAVVLREIEEVSTAEVAVALGSTEGTVRSQVSRAIARLRTLLAGEGK
jgi:RNA polymerase sigma-70 factor (ECF subfamily)